MNDSMQFPLTIVIPVYNRAAIVEKTLDSVAAQTYRPLRLIVVDNNSADSSLDVVSRWAGRHQSADFRVDVVTETTPGAAAARNRGLEMARSEWTMFFDSDDLMDHDHVSLAMDAVATHPGVELVGWDVRYHYLSGRVAVAPFEPRDIAYHNIMHGSLATQRYFATTGLFRRAGGWNQSVGVWDDIELGVRLLQLHPRLVKRRGRPTVDIYHNAESITSTSFSATCAGCRTALEHILKNYPVSSHVRLKEAILLGDCRAEGMPEAAGYFSELMARVPALRDRLCCRLAYYGRRLHVPGMARLLRLFLSKSLPNKS